MNAPGVQLLLLGDLCLAGEVEEYLLRHPEADLWSGFRGWLPESAIVVANLECSLSTQGVAKDGKYATLRADPVLFRHLQRLNVAVLANNHICDYGHVAARDTVRRLQEQGIDSLGYGESYADAVKPLIIERNGIRIGMLSYSCLSTNGENYATEDGPGVPMLSPSAVETGIRTLRPNVDVLILFVHWGLENERYPVIDQVRLARMAIDLGANAVIGCHGHVIQPYEHYRGGFIAYGLGNFLFGDVTCRMRTANGGVMRNIVKQQLENKESIAIHVGCRQRSSALAFVVEAVSLLRYDIGFAPYPCDADQMSVDPSVLNKRFQRHAKATKAALMLDRPFAYLSAFYRSGLTHYYHSPSVSAKRGEQGKLLKRLIRDGARQQRRAWTMRLIQAFPPLSLLRSCVRHLLTSLRPTVETSDSVPDRRV